MTDLIERQKVATKLIAGIQEAELVVRMIEAAAKVKRPEGATAMQTLAGTDQVVVGNYRRAAKAAMDYWRECINNAQVPS